MGTEDCVSIPFLSAWHPGKVLFGVEDLRVLSCVCELDQGLGILRHLELHSFQTGGPGGSMQTQGRE